MNYSLITFFVLLLLGVSPISQAQMFEFSPRDAAKIAERKLIVVLQEEDPAIIRLLRKDAERKSSYQNLILYTNNLIKNSTKSFWQANENVEFRTMKECEALSDSASYYVLDFASLRENENQYLFRLKTDTSNLYPSRAELMRRKEYGYFDLKLIEKLRGAPFYRFYIPSSVPNEFDFGTAFQFISSIVEEKLKDAKFSTRDQELKIQQQNEILASKILIVDSTIVNRQGKSYAYIREEYDSTGRYFLSDAKDVGAKIITKDSNYVYLTIVPYIDPISRGQSYLGTSGGSLNEYEKIIYFMQLIIDIKSGKIIYYDKAEESVVLVKDWKRFQRYLFNKINPTPIIIKTPVQEKHYYQPNQY